MEEREQCCWDVEPSWDYSCGRWQQPGQKMCAAFTCSLLKGEQLGFGSGFVGQVCIMQLNWLLLQTSLDAPGGVGSFPWE